MDLYRKLYFFVIFFYALFGMLGCHNSTISKTSETSIKNHNRFEGYCFNKGMGDVLDAVTAIKITEAVLSPIYDDVLEDERPFVATLDTIDNELVWTSCGTLLEEYAGGAAFAEIPKSDVKIKEVWHDNNTRIARIGTTTPHPLFMDFIRACITK